MRNSLKKILTSRIPQVLLFVFLVVMVMTIWWQVLFTDILDAYRESKRAEIKSLLNRAALDHKQKEQLLRQKLAIVVETCGERYCVPVENKFLTVNPVYWRTIEERRTTALTTFYSEAAFLLTVMTAGVVYLVYNLAREKKLNRERTRLHAMATHELKRPLNAVSLILQTLKRGALPPERQHEFLNKGIAQVETASRQLERLLKTQEHPLIPRRQVKAYSLAEFVKSLLQEQQSERLAFTNRISPGLDQIRIDQEALKAMFLNLVENALNYSEEKVYITLFEKKGRPTLEVKDSGLGLTPEEITSIAQPFYRSNNHEVQNRPGSGIGLFIVQHFVDALGFDLEITSPGRGKGSSFALVLK